jgi:hypothetical protein
VTAAASGSRGRTAQSAALFALLVVALYGDTLVLRRNFAGRDLIAYNLPMEKSVHDAWARGRLPVWTPEVSGGRPLAPNPNAGALYPLRAALAPLPLPLAVRLFPLVHWAAAGAGVLVLAASLGRSGAAGWVAAATYVFSGVVVGESFFPHIQPGMALLPWIVWAAGRRSGTPASRLLTLALLFAADFLAADIFTIGLALASAALWIAVEESGADARRGLGRLALAGALGALAAAPQLVASALWVPLTNRAVLGMKLSDVLFFSIHPLRLLELVIPYPLGAAWDLSRLEMWSPAVHHGRVLGLFPTLYAGAFAVIAVVVARRSRERGARFARLLLAACLAVSVAPALLPDALGGVPSPLPLRNPEKLAVGAVFALAVLAAVAFDAWRERPGRLGGWIAAGGALAALAAVVASNPLGAGRVAVALVGTDPSRAPDAARTLPLALAEAGLLWMLTVVSLGLLASRRRGAAVAAAALLVLAPIAANRRIARAFREDEVFAPTAYARWVARRDPAGEYRTLSESFFEGLSPLELAHNVGALSGAEFSRRAWYQYTPLLWGRGTVFNEDFDAGDLSRVESLRKLAGLAAGFRDSAPFFGTVSLRFGIRFRDQDAFGGFRPAGGDALQIWDEHPRAFPDVRLLERWREVAGSVDALRAIPSLGDGEVAIETGGAARAGAASAGRVRVIERTPERLVADLEAERPTWLFVLRAFWPHRTITIDGARVEAAAAQLAFSAVPVPAGRHRLVWEERLPGLRVSAWGTALFGMIAAGLLVSHWHRRTP